MRRRQDFTDPLRPDRHALKWKCEAGEQNRRQKEEERHLHRLQLILRDRRKSIADRKIGNDEYGERAREQREGAEHWHSKHELRTGQNDRALETTDQDI